jgi:antitoxin ParD1/3/4
MKHESELTTFTISVSWAMREFVEVHAARSGCATASEYMRRLILEAQKRAARDELERHLIAGLDSGAPIAITPE